MLGYAVILAAAFFAPDSGTEARAMGGTGVAFSDNPTAVWYNAANLAGQTGIGVLLDGNVLLTTQNFQRNGVNPDTPGDYPGAGEPFSSVSGEAPPQIIPILLGTYSLANDKLTIAAGAIGPTGPRQRFSEAGPQRFNLTEQWLVQLNYGVWAGYEVNRWLRVGGGFEGLYNTVEQALVASSASEDDLPTEDPQYDLLTELSAQSAFTPSGTLGFTISPVQLEGWHFGASFRPGATVSADGDLNTPSGPIRDVAINMEFAIPSQFRLGGGVERDSWQAELDLVVEDWSNHDDVVIDIDDDDPLVSLGLLPTELRLTHNYGTAYSVRLGGAKQLGENLRLMGGYYFETGVVPSRYMGVDSFDNFKHGINAGVGYTLGPVRLSGAYTFTYIQPREITDSQVESLTAFAPEDSFVVGNGQYDGFYNMISVSVLTRF